MKTLQDLKQTLISKNPFKRFQNNITNSSRSSASGNISDNNSKNKLFDMDINIDYNEGQSFLSTYIGNTVISFDTNEGNASKYISKIIEISKSHKNKNQRKVMIHISIKGFKISDCETSKNLIDASIYRISYVTISQSQKHIYAFIYQNPATKLIECHAFDCRTKNYAKLILRTSFIAFNLAYEKYYKEKDNKQRALLLKETNGYTFNDYEDDCKSCESKNEASAYLSETNSFLTSTKCVVSKTLNNSTYSCKWVAFSSTKTSSVRPNDESYITNGNYSKVF